MDNPNENSLNTLNLNANSISNVGSTSVITVQQSMTIISELIQSFMQKSNTEPTNLWLPRFNPDIAGSDPAVWCIAANRLMGENPLEGSALFSVLRHALEGSAAQWFQKVMVHEPITWPRFKECFTSRFGGNETATLTLMKMMKEQSLKDETMGTFAIRLRSFLKARWTNLSMDEIINAVVLVHLASEDQRIKQITLTKDIKTENQFLCEMKDLSYTEKWLTLWSDNTSTGTEAKQRKPSNSRIRCFYCGAFGHKIAMCRKRIRLEKWKNARDLKRNRPAASLEVSYYKCHGEDHDASDCPLFQKRDYNTNMECQVDSSTMEAPSDIDIQEDL